MSKELKQLHRSVINKDAEGVSKFIHLVDKNALSIPFENNNTLLHHVFSCGDQKIIELFTNQIEKLQLLENELRDLLKVQNNGHLTPVDRIIYENSGAITALLKSADIALLRVVVEHMDEHGRTLVTAALQELETSERVKFFHKMYDGIKSESSWLEFIQSGLSTLTFGIIPKPFDTEIREELINVELIKHLLFSPSTMTNVDFQRLLKEAEADLEKAREEAEQAQRVLNEAQSQAKNDKAALEIAKGKETQALHALQDNQNALEAAQTKHTQLEQQLHSNSESLGQEIKDFRTAVKSVSPSTSPRTARLVHRNVKHLKVDSPKHSAIEADSMKDIMPPEEQQLTESCSRIEKEFRDHEHLQKDFEAAQEELTGAQKRFDSSEKHVETAQNELTDAQEHLISSEKQLKEAQQQNNPAQIFQGALAVSKVPQLFDDIIYLSGLEDDANVNQWTETVFPVLKVSSTATMACITGNPLPLTTTTLNTKTGYHFMQSAMPNFINEGLSDIGLDATKLLVLGLGAAQTALFYNTFPVLAVTNGVALTTNFWFPEDNAFKSAVNIANDAVTMWHSPYTWLKVVEGLHLFRDVVEGGLQLTSNSNEDYSVATEDNSEHPPLVGDAHNDFTQPILV